MKNIPKTGKFNIAILDKIGSKLLDQLGLVEKLEAQQNIRVWITNPKNKSYSLFTDSDGFFVLENIENGKYLIDLGKNHYEVFVVNFYIKVKVWKKQNSNFTLSISYKRK